MQQSIRKNLQSACHSKFNDIAPGKAHINAKGIIRDNNLHEKKV